MLFIYQQSRNRVAEFYKNNVDQFFNCEAVILSLQGPTGSVESAPGWERLFTLREPECVNDLEGEKSAIMGKLSTGSRQRLARFSPQLKRNEKKLQQNCRLSQSMPLRQCRRLRHASRNYAKILCCTVSMTLLNFKFHILQLVHLLL